jgi:hypothetical protein
MQFGNVSEAIRPYFLNMHTMLLNGQMGDDHGRIMAWDDDERAFQWMVDRIHAIPGQGLLVLEAQERVLRFLVDCCAAILHDLPLDQLMSGGTSIDSDISSNNYTTTTPNASNDTSEVPSLATTASESPYRVPRVLDLGSLQALTAVKQSEAEDHIWQLREDPEYFAEELKDQREYRSECILDHLRKPHPHLGTPKFWDETLRIMIEQAYVEFWHWRTAHEDIAELKSLELKYRDKISPDQHLPTEFETALCNFQYFLDQMIDINLQRLNGVLPASPAFRHMFVRSNGTLNLQPKDPVDPKLGSSHYLIWLFRSLMDERQAFLIGIPNLIDELQRLVDKDREVHDLISSKVAHVFANLATVAELLRQIQMYQPWFAMISQKSGGEECRQVYRQKMKGYHDSVKSLQRPLYVNYGDPLDGRFAYPSHKRRTKDVTEVSRKPEQNPDEPWAIFDNGGNTRYVMSKHISMF